MLPLRLQDGGRAARSWGGKWGLGGSPGEGLDRGWLPCVEVFTCTCGVAVACHSSWREVPRETAAAPGRLLRATAHRSQPRWPYPAQGQQCGCSSWGTAACLCACRDSCTGGHPRTPLCPSPSPSGMWSSWDTLADTASSPPEPRALPLRAGGAGDPGPRPMSAGRAQHLPSCWLPVPSPGAPGPPRRRWKNVSRALWFPIFLIQSPESEKSDSEFPKTGGNSPVNQRPRLQRPAQDAKETGHHLKGP